MFGTLWYRPFLNAVIIKSLLHLGSSAPFHTTSKSCYVSACVLIEKTIVGHCKCPCFLYITLIIIEYINVCVYVCRSHVIYVLVQIQVLCDRDWKRRSKDWDADRLLPRVIQDTQPGNTTYRKVENCSLKRIRLKPWIEAELWTDIRVLEYRQK